MKSIMMGKLFKSNKRTYLCFFGLGILVFVVTSILGFKWLDMVRYITRQPYLIYDRQPAILKFIHSKLLLYAIWLVLLCLIIADRLRGRNFARTISYSIGVFLSYAISIGYMIGRPIISDYVNRIPFDSVSWKKEVLMHSENPVRIRMVNNLLKTRNIKGMSGEQIEELLGTPEPTDYFREYDYVYWLGPERSLISIDSEWLGIKIENDTVVDVKILHD